MVPLQDLLTILNRQLMFSHFFSCILLESLQANSDELKISISFRCMYSSVLKVRLKYSIFQNKKFDSVLIRSIVVFALHKNRNKVEILS